MTQQAGAQQAGVPVGIIMGSQSDWATMREAAAILDELGVPYDKVYTPQLTVTFDDEGRAQLRARLATLIQNAVEP